MELVVAYLKNGESSNRIGYKFVLNKEYDEYELKNTIQNIFSTYTGDTIVSFIDEDADNFCCALSNGKGSYDAFFFGDTDRKIDPIIIADGLIRRRMIEYILLWRNNGETRCLMRGFSIDEDNPKMICVSELSFDTTNVSYKGEDIVFFFPYHDSTYNKEPNKIVLSSHESFFYPIKGTIAVNDITYSINFEGLYTISSANGSIWLMALTLDWSTQNDSESYYGLFYQTPDCPIPQIWFSYENDDGNPLSLSCRIDDWIQNPADIDESYYENTFLELKKDVYKLIDRALKKYGLGLKSPMLENDTYDDNRLIILSEEQSKIVFAKTWIYDVASPNFRPYHYEEIEAWVDAAMQRYQMQHPDLDHVDTSEFTELFQEEAEFCFFNSFRREIIHELGHLIVCRFFDIDYKKYFVEPNKKHSQDWHGGVEHVGPDRYNYNSLENQICVKIAGHIAEEYIYGSSSGTWASDYIWENVYIIDQMLCSSSFSLRNQNIMISWEGVPPIPADDIFEIKHKQYYEKTKKIILDHKDLIIHLADLLEERYKTEDGYNKVSLSREEIDALFDKQQ